MYSYETLVLLRPDLPEAQLRETVDRAKRLIEGMEGVHAETQDWGVRDLAYPVQKNSRGYYVLMRYKSKPEAVWELERTLKIADEVMRFVTVRESEMKPRKTKASDRPSRPSLPVEEDAELAIPEDF